MNKYLVAAFVIAGCSISTAGAQTFRASVNDNRREPAQRQPAPIYSGKAVGAFPRTARNPVQLINPRAPQRYYGPPEETVVANDVGSGPPYNRGESVNRYTGVILFGLRW